MYLRCTISLTLIAFLFFPILSTAQSAKKLKALQEKENSLTINNLKKHIGILAADSLEGRRTGTEGEAKAVRYIVSQYKLLGIAPGDDDKDYIQSFEIDEGKIVSDKASLQLNDKALALNKEWFPLAWSAEKEVKGAAALALHETGLPWWMDLKETLENNSKNPHFLAEQFVKDAAKDAAEKGATALVLYNSSAINDSLLFNPKDRTKAATIPVIYISNKAMQALQLDPESSPYLEANIAFTPKKRTGHNVIAWLDNGAPYTIVLGAHLDHLGYGEDANSRNVGEPAIHNGADDNASGTAALLELARKLNSPDAGTGKKAIPKEPLLQKHNYLFIHFSGEEVGLYGSKYFVEHPTMDLSKINGMINMDMIGRLNDSAVLTVGGIGTSPAWSQVLPNAAAKGLKVKFDSAGTGPSDHSSFYRKDIPVLFFFTGQHTDYHKPSDDADKINYTGETNILNYIMEVVRNLGNQGHLAFTKTREQSMGTGRFKVSIGIMPDYTYSGVGVRADGVIDGRPAQKAGLKAGDVIVKLGDFDITGMETYMQALNKFEKGQSTHVVVKRGEETRNFELTF
jgi:aminopeptidase YwaD